MSDSMRQFGSVFMPFENTAEGYTDEAKQITMALYQKLETAYNDMKEAYAEATTSVSKIDESFREL